MASPFHKLGYRFVRAGAVGVVLWCVAPCLGQVSQLPMELVTSSQIGSSEEARIEEFVSREFERLRSEDPDQMEDARRSLEHPFVQREAPSIAFRLSYGGRVAFELRPLLDGGDVRVIINGLQVAGRCGTPQTVDLVGGALDDRRASVRAAASSALHGVIREATAGRVREDQGEKAVRLVGGALGDANDAAFALACVFALSSTERTSLHDEAAAELVAAIPSVAAQLQNAPRIERATLWEQAMQLGLRLVYVHILQAGGQIDRGMARGAVEAGAHVLAFVATRAGDVGAGELFESEEGERLAGLVGQAEQLMIIAAGRAIPGTPARQEALRAAFERSLEDGDEGAFLDAADDMFEWIERVTGKGKESFGL